MQHMHLVHIRHALKYIRKVRCIENMYLEPNKFNSTDTNVFSFPILYHIAALILLQVENNCYLGRKSYKISLMKKKLLTESKLLLLLILVFSDTYTQNSPCPLLDIISQATLLYFHIVFLK